VRWRISASLTGRGGGGREKFWRLVELELAPSAYGGFGAYGEEAVIAVCREASLDSLETDCVL